MSIVKYKISWVIITHRKDSGYSYTEKFLVLKRKVLAKISIRTQVSSFKRWRSTNLAIQMWLSWKNASA